MELSVYQYEIGISEDELFGVLDKLSRNMEINIDYSLVRKALTVEEWDNPDGICIFRNEINNNFIMLDTTGPTDIYKLIVRYNGEEYHNIKEILISIVNEIAESFGEDDYIDDLDNTYNSENDGYIDALKRFKLA